MVLTENMVWKRVIDVANIGLSVMGIPSYHAIQHSQPINVSDRKCVLVSRVDSSRIGWVAEHFDKSHPDKDLMNHFVEWIDKVGFQFSTFADRTLADSEDTVSSFDVVNLLATFFNMGAGVDECRKRGIQPLRISDVRRPNTTSDSTQYEFNPNFDVQFAVPQSVRFDIPTFKIVKLHHHDEDGQINVVDAQFYDAEKQLKIDLNPEEVKGLVQDGDSD